MTSDGEKKKYVQVILTINLIGKEETNIGYTFLFNFSSKRWVNQISYNYVIIDANVSLLSS